jgi:TolB protein
MRRWFGIPVASVVGAVVLAACIGGGPDGRILVTTPEGGVEIRMLDGTAGPVITDSGGEGPVQPTPSPDGSSVVSSITASSGARIWHAGDVTRVDLGFTPFYYAWSPDGSRFAALGNGESGVVGAVADPRTGSITSLEGARPFFLAWSPDSTRLATFKDGRAVAVVEPGMGEIPLSESGGLFQAPEWLDESSVLAVVGSPLTSVGLGAASDAPSRIARISVADGETSTVVETRPYASFSLDDRRERLAVLDGDPNTLLIGRLRVVAVDGHAPPVIVADAGVLAYEWSPDAELLLYIRLSGDELVPAVWDGTSSRDFGGFRPSSSFLSEYLPFWGQYVRSLTTWSPQSDAFVYAASTDSGEVIRIQRLADADTVELGPGSFASWLR